MHEFKFSQRCGQMATLLLMTFLSICCIIGGLLSGFHSENCLDMNPNIFKSWTYQQSAVMFFISTIPAIIDLILDMTQMNETHVRIFCSKYVGRVLIAISCFIVSIQFKVLDVTPSIFNMTTNRSLSYISSLFCLRLVLACSMLLILMANNNRIFTFRNVFWLNTFACITTVMKFFTLTNTGLGHMITLIVTFIGLIFSIIMFIVWIYRMCTTIKIMTVNDYTCILYFITTFIVGIMAYLSIMQVLTTGTYTNTGLTQYDENNLAFANYALTVLSIILTVVSSRISRYEAYVYMKNNIKTKTEYVRFISHELRTPLNSVFLGLNLSISQIPEHAECKEEKERRDTLMEIASACSAALDILNQLLFFDKLDNGILELNKSNTRVTELIHDAIKMFTVQIREKNIDMKIQNNDAGVISTERSRNSTFFDHLSPRLSFHIKSGSDLMRTKIPDSYSIYTNEMIEIDKNKMIQVIRNIVSNAIKFTPEYGQISINLKFEMNHSTSMTDNKKDDHKRVFDRKTIMTSMGNTSKKNATINHDELQDMSTCQKHSSISQDNYPTCNDKHVHVDPSYKHNDLKNSLTHDTRTYPFYLSSSSSSINDSTNSHMSPNHVVTFPKKSDKTHKKEKDILTSSRDYGNSVDGFLVIEVTDTGAGISDENQQKLFREIIQFNPEILQNGGGSGLGMWISKGIVDLHGGTISVSSEGEGRGSTFTIKLPMIRIYDESIISSSKLSDCIHIKDHTSLNLLQTMLPTTTPYTTTPTWRDTADTTVAQNKTANLLNTCQTKSVEHMLSRPPDSIKIPDDMKFQHDIVSTDCNIGSSLLAPHQTDRMMSSPFTYSPSSSIDISSFEAMKSLSLPPVHPRLHSSTSFNLSASLSSSSINNIHNNMYPMITYSVPDSKMYAESFTQMIGDTYLSTSVTDVGNFNKLHTPYIESDTIQDSNISSHSRKVDRISPLDVSENNIIDHKNAGNQCDDISSTKESKTILVVDDSSMNRKMLCRLLKSSGYMCIEANDGVEAVNYIHNYLQNIELDISNHTTVKTSPLASSMSTLTSKDHLRHDSSYKSTKNAISQTKIDCIIMDFMMPNMDGPTATAEIRKLGYTGPIIGATGNALQADIDYFIEKGANKVLIKPLDMSSVLSSIQQP